MICLHLERKTQHGHCIHNSLLHAFFGLVSGGIEEIRRGLSVYEGSLRDEQRRCMNTKVKTGQQI